MHRAELQRAITRIAGRRTKIDDPHREQLAESPAEVLDFLARYPARERWVREADISDGLVLHVWCWWEDQRRLHRYLTDGLRLGVPASQLGSPLGIGAKGLRSRLDRLDALLRYDIPDESLTREYRRAQRATDDTDQRMAWVRANHERLSTVAAKLLAHAWRNLGETDEQDWIDELAADYRTGQFSPGSMTVLGLACGELRAAGPLAGTAQRALRAADELRADYTAATST